MEELTINPILVEQINGLVAAWTAADRRIRDMFHGWEQRATRAGLERGFYMQLATLPGAETFADGDLEDEEAGQLIYAAYKRGNMIAATDTIA